MRNLRRLAAIVLASLAVLQGGGSPAQAAAASGVVATGTVTPGIPGPTDPSVNNAYSFTGTMAGVFNTTPGTCNLAFNGNGNDTLTNGNGAGSYTCNGAGININCVASFTRVGLTVLVQGTCNTGTAVGQTIWVCTAVPTSYPPTSYVLICFTVII